MGRELGDVSLQHELWVKKCQLSRAMDRFFAGEDAVLEVDLPEREALQRRPARVERHDLRRGARAN